MKSFDGRRGPYATGSVEVLCGARLVDSNELVRWFETRLICIQSLSYISVARTEHIPSIKIHSMPKGIVSVSITLLTYILSKLADSFFYLLYWN